MAQKKSEPATETIVISMPKVKHQVYRIKGTAPLHCNRMSEETKQLLIDKATGENQAGAKPSPKSKEAQFEDSLYRLPANNPYRAQGYEYGFPGRAMKKALVNAARPTGRTMADVKQLIRVKADLLPIIVGEPVCHAEIINKQGSSCASIRAKFDEWEMLVPLGFIQGAKGLTANEVVSLLNLAGETVGLGCGRSINDGTNGSFEVVPQVVEIKND